jgi:hypothetical protein
MRQGSEKSIKGHSRKRAKRDAGKGTKWQVLRTACDPYLDGMVEPKMKNIKYASK